jgi:long-chain acyl-CoA synthetase
MTDKPWLKFYGSVPHHLDYPDISIFQLIDNTAKAYPDLIAYDFLGTKASYSQFIDEIHRCAKSFKSLGIEEGDRVTVCLPNIPQAIAAFYGINMIGAVANMIHPLSS